MPGGLLSGLFRYRESELEPAVQAEILLESARSEARVAILEVILALFFLVWWQDYRDLRFRAVALFCVLTVIPLLADSWLRRSVARRLLASSGGGRVRDAGR